MDSAMTRRCFSWRRASIGLNGKCRARLIRAFFAAIALRPTSYRHYLCRCNRASLHRCTSLSLCLWSASSSFLTRPHELGAVLLSQRRSVGTTTMQDVPVDELLQASEVIKVPTVCRVWLGNVIGILVSRRHLLVLLLCADCRLQIRKELALLPGQKISKLQFCATCSKYGIQEPAALKLLEAFHRSGVVLNFSISSSQELRDTVFVKPQV